MSTLLITHVQPRHRKEALRSVFHTALTSSVATFARINSTLPVYF